MQAAVHNPKQYFIGQNRSWLIPWLS